MCIQWTLVLYAVVITWQSNLPISQFNSLCNKCMSVWSMFPCNISAVFALFINNHIQLPLHIPTYTQLTLQSMLHFDYISVNTSSIYPSLAVIALTGMCLGVELLVSEQGVIYVSVLYLPVLLCRSLGPQDEYGSLASRTCKYTTVSLFNYRSIT